MTISRNKASTLTKIITAAEQEFSAQGFNGANIEVIAQHAGVTKQLIYHYFKSKDKLYRATLESVSESMEVLSDLSSYECLPPEEAIRHLIDRVTEEFIKHPSYASLTLDQALHNGEHISQSSHFIPTMRMINSDILQPILRRGIDQGVFKANLNIDTIFWMIFQLTAACFLNGKIMSEVSDIDFCSSSGIKQWGDDSYRFIINAIKVSS